MNKSILEQWFLDHGKVLKVGRYLVDEEGMTAEELLYFFEKPWKWTDVYEMLERNGK